MHPGRWKLAAAFGAVLAVVTGVLAFVLTTASSGGSARRALSADQADRFAVTRFRNYQARGRAVLITIPSPTGTLSLSGAIDFRQHVGYGLLRGGTSDQLVQWTTTAVILHPAGGATTAPADPPADGWKGRALLASGSTFDTALLVALNLGGDRPENAQLLRQSSAAWVGSDRIAGQAVDVFDGPAAGGAARADAASDSGGAPSNTRFWVGTDGTMYRARIAVATAGEPVVVDLQPSGYSPIAVVPGLQTGNQLTR